MSARPRTGDGRPDRLLDVHAAAALPGVEMVDALPAAGDPDTLEVQRYLDRMPSEKEDGDDGV